MIISGGDPVMSRMIPLAIAVVLTGCVDTTPHLRPVPSHLSDEAKEFLGRTRQDINENYVEKMGAIHREAAPDFRTGEVEVGGVKCFWVTSPKAVR